MNILEAWRTCRQHWPTALGAGACGAIPCVGAYVTMHGDLSEALKPYQLPILVVALVASLAFSVRTVYLFGRDTFGETLKAAFLVLSLEGYMVASPTHWLGLVALAALICINAVATVCHLVSQDTKPVTESPVVEPALPEALPEYHARNVPALSRPPKRARVPT